MKKIVIICIILYGLFIPLFADDYLYFGGNYSNTMSGGKMSHGIGGTFSSLGDYGGSKRVYASFGFTADVSGKRELNTSELKKLGVNQINLKFYSIPIRMGYPFILPMTNDLQLLLIPALAFNIHFFRADFTQRIYGHQVKYDMSGWGFSLGSSVNLGLQHKFTKIYLRYGVDFDIRLFTLLIADIKYSGYIHGTTSTAGTDTIANNFMITTSPYLCIGFKL